jgi:mRNA degradation ribonuclease J1/J2
MEDHLSQRGALATLSPHAPHIKENVDSNHARYRSETVIKERPQIKSNGYSTVRGIGEGSSKKLPNIKYATPSASKEAKAMFSGEPRESFRTIVDKALDQAKTEKVFENQNSSLRNYYKAIRSHQNQTTFEIGSLPKLNLKIQGHHHHPHHHH